jgi:cytoplasmic FMR1 interacting protein
VVPEGLYDALIKVVDLLQKLDNLKDMKASLNNDFSRYKRALGSIYSDLPDGEALSEEMHALQLFLGNPAHPKQLIFYTLRDAVKRINGHEEVLCEMIEQCASFLDEENYVTPEEKYRLIRAIPHLMLLADGVAEVPKSFNVFKNKLVNVSRLQKIFKQYPYVPVIGDMSITLTVILSRAPHYEDEKEHYWGYANVSDKSLAERYSLSAKVRPPPRSTQTHPSARPPAHPPTRPPTPPTLPSSPPTQWRGFREAHLDWMANFTSATSILKRSEFSKDPLHALFCKDVKEIVLGGFMLVRDMSCAVTENSVWKFTHPVNDDSLGAKNIDVNTCGEYERVVRYNYTKAELSVLVDTLSMIKSIAGQLQVSPLREQFASNAPPPPHSPDSRAATRGDAGAPPPPHDPQRPAEAGAGGHAAHPEPRGQEEARRHDNAAPDPQHRGRLQAREPPGRLPQLQKGPEREPERALRGRVAHPAAPHAHHGPGALRREVRRTRVRRLLLEARPRQQRGGDHGELL